MQSSKEMPLEAAIAAQMKRIMDAIMRDMPDGYGATLLVFKYGHGNLHRMNYASTANRADMVAAMKEFIAHAEGRAVDSPEAKQ